MQSTVSMQINAVCTNVYSSWLGFTSILHQEQNHLHTTHCCTLLYVSLATYVQSNLFIMTTFVQPYVCHYNVMPLYRAALSTQTALWWQHMVPLYRRCHYIECHYNEGEQYTITGCLAHTIQS